MAALVLYRPPSTTLDLVRNLLERDFLVVVWMNSSGELPTHSSLVRLGSGTNVGLSIPFNAFFDYAKVVGFHEFLYLDQDALVGEGVVQEFDTAIGLLRTANHAAIQFSDYQISAGPTLVKLVFSNGCVFKVDCPVRHSKGFFVEGVDYDYCLNAARSGYSIAVVSSNSVIHKLVQPRRTYYAFGHEFVHRPYSVRRNVEFLWALTKLAVRSCYFKKLDFFYIFMRNIFTHIAVLGRSWIFFALWRMRLITKIDDNL
jgi:GT2 family glycosyltransferase